MRVIVSLFAVLVLSQEARCMESPGKDGFNFYKDYLRGKTEDVVEDGPISPEKMLYFYRTPLQLYPGVLPAVLEQEYRKRTGNVYKNHMLSKEPPPVKRISKTALSFIMANKHEPYNQYNYADEENGSQSLRSIP